ncbi:MULTISPECIES: hypothetical protein [unclassified Streptomyces]|uniref:hypothetical protein n=1 Tax=unclassified Streptomyces TaxID=2593676 RepID=UPI0028855F8B|nr:hypothetical protein [Streptomyces sp. DSM 41633]
MTPAALAVGSLIGGLLYGRRTWPGTPTRQLRTLGCGFAVGSLPTLADPAPALAITAAVLPGLFLAPLPVTAFHTLDFLGPRLLSAWLIASLGLGQAGGIALAGLVPAATAPAAAAGVAAGGAAAGSVVLPPLHPCCRPPSGGGYSAEPPTRP